MSEKIADVIREIENNKADRQEQYFFRTDQLTVGYDGKPLIREINIQLKKEKSSLSSVLTVPGNPPFLKASPDSLLRSAVLFIWIKREWQR